MKKNIKAVAIIGGGPSGCSLATLLKRKGFKVAVFIWKKDPRSLLANRWYRPLFLFLRELGVEDEVKSYTVLWSAYAAAFNPYFHRGSCCSGANDNLDEGWPAP